MLNSATSEVTSHHTVGFRTGNYSVNYQNDMGRYPGILFGGGTDQGHTASAILNVSLGGSSYVSGGYEQFTGRPFNYREASEGRHHTYTQTRDQSILNRANHFVGIGNANHYFAAGISGWHSGQNAVHYVKDLPDFEQTDGFRLSGDYRKNID